MMRKPGGKRQMLPCACSSLMSAFLGDQEHLENTAGEANGPKSISIYALCRAIKMSKVFEVPWIPKKHRKY